MILHFKKSCYVLALRSTATLLITTSQRAAIGVATGMKSESREFNKGAHALFAAGAGRPNFVQVATRSHDERRRFFRDETANGLWLDSVAPPAITTNIN